LQCHGDPREADEHGESRFGRGAKPQIAADNTRHRNQCRRQEFDALRPGDPQHNDVDGTAQAGELHDAGKAAGCVGICRAAA